MRSKAAPLLGLWPVIGCSPMSCTITASLVAVPAALDGAGGRHLQLSRFGLCRHCGLYFVAGMFTVPVSSASQRSTDRCRAETWNNEHRLLAAHSLRRALKACHLVG